MDQITSLKNQLEEEKEEKIKILEELSVIQNQNVEIQDKMMENLKVQNCFDSIMDHKNEEIKRLQVLVDMLENEDVINSSTEKSINKMKRRIELLQARVIQLLTSQNKSNYRSTKMQTFTRYFDHSQV